MGRKPEWPRPKLTVSRCLGFEACRYDGSLVKCPLVEQLRPFADFIPVCPEVGAGLGVPRKPIRLVRSRDGYRLVELETGKDRTDEVSRFSTKFISDLDGIDGMILKSRSPSCAAKDAKLYWNATDAAEIGYTVGLFAKMASAAFPGAVLEDDVGLSDALLRDEFLTKLFTVARFRASKIGGRVEDLRKFHVETRLLLQSRDRRRASDLDTLLGCADAIPQADLFRDYERALLAALARVPTRASHSRIMTQIVRRLGNQVTPSHRVPLLKTLEDLRRGRLPPAVARELIRNWAAGLNEEDPGLRIYLEPYPAKLRQAPLRDESPTG